MSAAAIAFQDELAQARALAADRRRAWDEAPELTADEILAGFKRELRSVSVPGFGAIYYYHPVSIAERIELESKLQLAADGSTSAANMVQGIIAFARNSDGSSKFKQEHAAALLEAPAAAVAALASAVVQSHRFTLVSAEKK